MLICLRYGLQTVLLFWILTFHTMYGIVGYRNILCEGIGGDDYDDKGGYGAWTVI